MSAQPDPWQVITDVTSALLLGGQTASIRCTAALRVLDAAGIDFSGNPVKAAAAQPARGGPVSAHFITADAGREMQLVCAHEDASDVECDETIAVVEPGSTWDEMESRIAAHAAECHPEAAAAQPEPGTVPLDAALLHQEVRRLYAALERLASGEWLGTQGYDGDELQRRVEFAQDKLAAAAAAQPAPGRGGPQ